jgi:Flp pilus assembly protein TadB
MTESPPPLVRDEKTPGSPAERSLVDDVQQLFDDGKTYVEAELAYQSTRAQFVVDHLSQAALKGLLGAVFLVIALITLSVGAVLALDAIVGIWVAIAIVVLFWTLSAGFLFYRMLRGFHQIKDAMGASEKERRHEEEGE